MKAGRGCEAPFGGGRRWKGRSGDEAEIDMADILWETPGAGRARKDHWIRWVEDRRECGVDARYFLKAKNMKFTEESAKFLAFCSISEGKSPEFKLEICTPTVSPGMPLELPV